MNPTSLTSLALDTSGTSIDNRVVNEPHILGNYRFRALVPDQGAFYADSTFSLVDDVTQRILTLGIDYKFLVPYQSLSQLYAKDICGAAIIINMEVSNKVNLTYQAVGSDYVHNMPALVDLLSTDNLVAISDSFKDIQDRPTVYMPSPHIQDMGDGVGFEYLCFAIETLGRVINNADNKVLATMFERIDFKLQEIAQHAIYRQDNDLMAFLNSFKDNFTKESLGLGNTPNMKEASESEGSWAAQETYNPGADINNRLVTLKSLISFREELMSRVVSNETTNLGKIYGKYILPTLAGLESMTNGSRYIVDSLDANLIANVTISRQIYPDLVNPTHRWALTKVTNNPLDRGGVFQAFNMSTGQTYTGIMNRVGGVPQIVWRRQMVESDVTDIVDQLTRHINNKDNPHKLTAAGIALEQVENLPVADRLTILGRKPKREYLTYDGLQLFFAAFISGDWTIDDSTTATAEQKAKARNAYTTLFATAGIYDDEELNVFLEPRATQKPVPVRGTPAGWYCEGTTKISKITDGFGGYYLENTLNDSDCGYETVTANYQIKDQDNVLIGLGYTAGGLVDPNATVALQDANGVTVCFIYPSSVTGRQTAIRNSAGVVFGYAIDPA